MSLSTDLEVRHIEQLSRLFEKEVELKEKLSEIHDEIVNLKVCMSEEDIHVAYLDYEQRMKEKYGYGCF